MDLDWKTWTAILGAFTGTVSLAMQIFSKWPRFRWAPIDDRFGPDDRVMLSVENPSVHPLMVSRVWAWPTSYEALPVRVEDTTDDTVRDVVSRMRTGRIPLMVQPGQTRAYRINTINEGSWAILVVVWHRYWFLPFRMMTVRRLSRKIVDEVNHGAR